MKVQSMFDFQHRVTAKNKAPVQYEMVCDNFAGAGGASMGIEAALGRAVDVAINHNPLAVQIHAVNHPNTKHECENIWKVDPAAICAGRQVGLAWFSPDCKHFSRAKGGKPVSKKIRGLAWVVTKWAKLVQPRVIILENVSEFQTWGPVGRDGKPIASRKGETFRRWVKQLQNYGYQVEWRELVAADFGVPTIRRRLFLIARHDGETIVWPKATHSKRKLAKATGLRPWRPAADCIDWNLPTRSIFGRKRPLADNTMKRIAKGLKRYVLEAAEPFLVVCNHGGEHFRGQSIKEPLPTLTASRDSHGVIVPYVAGVGGRAGQSPERSVQDPAATTTAKADTAVVTPYLIQTDQTGGNGAYSSPVDDPTKTQISKNNQALVVPHITHFYGLKGNETRASSPDVPLATQTADPRFGLVGAFLNKHYGRDFGNEAGEPLGTETAKNKHSLSAAFFTKFRGTAVGQDPSQPMPTITGQGQHVGEVRAFFIKYFGTATGADVRDPAHTLTGKHRLGLVLVRGVWHQIIDICLRMLTPRELLRAQFGKYAKDYVLLGTAEQQVAGIGNSVCPEVAEALVKANVVIRLVTALQVRA